MTRTLEQFRNAKRWRYERAHGITRQIDAEPARLHIAKCLGAGMSLRAISAAAGISPTAVHRLHHGQPLVRRETAAAVLAVQPGVTLQASEGTSEPFVPALGTRRRIRALIALGWTHAEISRRSGHRTNVVVNQQGRWVTASLHTDIARVYDDLCMTPGPSDLNRRRAIRLGYAPPLMWDDIDHDAEPADTDLEDSEQDDIDETAVERAVAGEPAALTGAERREAIRRLSATREPLSDKAIAQRIGSAQETVLRIRKELGIEAVSRRHEVPETQSA